MSTSGIIVVLVIVALAAAGLVYLEMNSRRNGRKAAENDEK